MIKKLIAIAIVEETALKVSKKTYYMYMLIQIIYQIYCALLKQLILDDIRLTSKKIRT